MFNRKFFFSIVAAFALMVCSGSVYAHGTKKHGAQEPRMELKRVDLYVQEMSAEEGKRFS